RQATFAARYLRPERACATLRTGIRRLLLAVAGVLAALVVAPAALAGIAEVRDAHGNLVAQAGAGFYASSNDGGWALRYDSATRSAKGVSLSGVSLPGGPVYAERIFVPPHRPR